MVDVFREVKRVLRPDGTLWLNIGDSYNANGRIGHGTRIGYKQGTNRASANGSDHTRASDDGLKEKDLMMVPARLAIALCDDGWYLRSDIIWAKRAPMPESVTDRPTSAHEHIFLLTKQPRYFYDADAVREPHEDVNVVNGVYQNQKAISKPGYVPKTQGFVSGGGGIVIKHRDYNPMGRNARNVWTLSQEPFPLAHFATFPTEIPRRCIKAGTSEKGCCAACGAPWVRMVERATAEPARVGSWKSTGGNHRNDIDRKGGFYDQQAVTTGWKPSCSCAAEVVPCTVLDPFAGAGTTGLVADELGRDCTLIELNASYAEMSRQRIYGAAPMFAAVEVI